MKMPLILVALYSLMVAGPVAALSTSTDITPESLDDAPCGIVATYEMAGSDRSFEVWAAIPVERENVVGQLVTSLGGQVLSSCPVEPVAQAGGRAWQFSLTADALPSSVFTIVFVASGGPAFDAYHLALGPLVEHSFRALSDAGEGLESAPVDSLGLFSPRVRYRLELGPEAETAAFHLAEPN